MCSNHHFCPFINLKKMQLALNAAHTAIKSRNYSWTLNFPTTLNQPKSQNLSRKNISSLTYIKWVWSPVQHYKAPIQKCYDWSGTKWLCFDVMEKSLWKYDGEWRAQSRVGVVHSNKAYWVFIDSISLSEIISHLS